MDRLGELLRVVDIGGRSFHPDQIGVRSDRQGLADRIVQPAADLVEALWSAGHLGVPVEVDAEFSRLAAHGPERGRRGEGAPLVLADGCLIAFFEPVLQASQHCLPDGHETGVGLPASDHLIGDLVVGLLDDGLVGAGGLFGCGAGQGSDARAIEPRVGRCVFLVGDLVEREPVEDMGSCVVEEAHQGQRRQFVRRDIGAGRSEDEGVVPLVAAVVEEVRGLGIGAGHDDAWHPHDVELEASGVEALDLFVNADENLAALVAALLGAGALVLYVIAGDPDLDEPADEVAQAASPP